MRTFMGGGLRTGIRSRFWTDEPAVHRLTFANLHTDGQGGGATAAR